MTQEGMAFVYEAIGTKLATAYGQKVFAEQAIAGTARPFVVYELVGGGQERILPKDTASYVIRVRCVADDMETAMTGMQTANGAIDNQGANDTTPGTWASSPDWIMSNVSKGAAYMLVENIAGKAQQVYHAGSEYHVVIVRS